MYQSSFVRYERRGDRVVPVRVVKAWIAPPGEGVASKSAGHKRLAVVRVTEIKWPRRPDLFVNTAPGAVKCKAPMRADLIARGSVKPAGVGACLELDDKAWQAAA